MKVLMINSVCGIGSTGRICVDIAERLTLEGHECKIAYGRNGNVPNYAMPYAKRIGTDFDVKVHGLITRLFDAHGFGSRNATKRFVRWIKEYDPDIIHLHNLHGYYLHIGILFDALKKMNKPVVWTLHDCWAFTGHCVHYTAAGCLKWHTQCHHCNQRETYPTSLLADRSMKNYQIKCRLFNSPQDMVIVTPSDWLAEQVQQSFLGQWPVKTIYNGINSAVFHNTPSNIKVRYGLQDNRIVLGVANIWDTRKGLTHMLQLSKFLTDDWRIVLIGLTEKQSHNLPSNVIGISRTENVNELAAWYSAADVYVNVSAEETMGLTTAEAIACGTPVVAYATTATPEIVANNGFVVKYGDIQGIADSIHRISKIGKESFRTDCERFALEKQYDKYRQLYQYLEKKQ